MQFPVILPFPRHEPFFLYSISLPNQSKSAGGWRQENKGHAVVISLTRSLCAITVIVCLMLM